MVCWLLYTTNLHVPILPILQLTGLRTVRHFSVHEEGKKKSMSPVHTQHTKGLNEGTNLCIARQPAQMLKVLASSSNLLQPDQAHFRRITVSIGTGSVPFVVVVVVVVVVVPPPSFSPPSDALWPCGVSPSWWAVSMCTCRSSKDMDTSEHFSQ